MIGKWRERAIFVRKLRTCLFKTSNTVTEMNLAHFLVGAAMLGGAILAELCQATEVTLFEQAPFEPKHGETLMQGLVLTRAVSIFAVIVFDLILRQMHNVAALILCIFAWPCLCRIKDSKGESSGSEQEQIRDNQIMPNRHDLGQSPQQLINVMPETEMFDQQSNRQAIHSNVMRSEIWKL